MVDSSHDNVGDMQPAFRRRIVGMWTRLLPENPALVTPVFSSLSLPHQFNRKLGFVEALVAVTAAFARIMTLCAVFAVWGAVSLLAWSRLATSPWRFLALVPMLLALPAALIPPLIAITAVERRARPRRS
jgi:uncharacterized membrane protein